MPKIVACPYCQKEYSLPDDFEGKRVRCRACNKPFAPIEKARATRPATKQTDASELAKLGITPIKSQPDIFSSGAAQGPDVLRNHVVQDPGFSLGVSAQGDGSQALADTDVADVVQNPYLKGTGQNKNSAGAQDEAVRRRQREEEILKAYSTPSSGDPSQRKKKKATTVGINRGSYFAANFALNFICNILTFVGFYAIGYQVNQEDISPETAPAMALVIIGSVGLILLVGSTLIVRSRYLNMKFASSLWPNLAAGAVAAPFLLICLTMLVALTGVAPLVFICLILILVSCLPALVATWGCVIFPPNFAVEKRLDGWSYFWIAVIVLSFVLPFMLFVVLSLF